MAGTVPTCPIHHIPMVWDATAGCYKCPKCSPKSALRALVFKRSKKKNPGKIPCVTVLTCKGKWRARIWMSIYIEEPGRAAPAMTCPKCGYRPMIYDATTGCYRCPKCGVIVVT